jgi:hypothetical protein
MTSGPKDRYGGAAPVSRVERARARVEQAKRQLATARRALAAAQAEEEREERARLRAEKERRAKWDARVYWAYIRFLSEPRRSVSVAAFARRYRRSTYAEILGAIKRVGGYRYRFYDKAPAEWPMFGDSPAFTGPSWRTSFTPFDLDYDSYRLQCAILAHMRGTTEDWEEELLNKHSTAQLAVLP